LERRNNVSALQNKGDKDNPGLTQKLVSPIFCLASSHAIISETGEMTEWLKVPVLKTGVGIPYRGFESHSLRHIGLTRTLGSRCVAEGFFYFSI
jgi:hypothetical protein